MEEIQPAWLASLTSTPGSRAKVHEITFTHKSITAWTQATTEVAQEGAAGCWEWEPLSGTEPEPESGAKEGARVQEGRWWGGLLTSGRQDWVKQH